MATGEMEKPSFLAREARKVESPTLTTLKNKSY